MTSSLPCDQLMTGLLPDLFPPSRFLPPFPFFSMLRNFPVDVARSVLFYSCRLSRYPLPLLPPDRSFPGNSRPLSVVTSPDFSPDLLDSRRRIHFYPSLPLKVSLLSLLFLPHRPFATLTFSYLQTSIDSVPFFNESHSAPLILPLHFPPAVDLQLYTSSKPTFQSLLLLRDY